MSQTIINGDSAEVLKQFESNSIDAVITDPPYGIEFLGKEWDTNTGAIEIWQECLRVLKPGGYLLAFSAARTYHHLATNIEQVGFEIRDQIMWLYASGFPKAQDIGKAIQKRQGVEQTQAHKNNVPRIGGAQSVPQANNDVVPTSAEAQQWSGWKTALKPAHEPIVMARKPFKGSTIDNVLEHGVGALNIDESRIPFESEAEAEADRKWREKWCEHNVGAPTFQGTDINEQRANKKDKPPAHEPIVMARKPFKGSTIDNVLTHGVGALNIDESRVPYEGEADMKEANVFKGTRTTGMDQYCEPSGTLDKNKEKLITGNTEGRFPSNVVGEVEGYQKFFYCPKVSRKERHRGFEQDSIPDPLANYSQGDVKNHPLWDPSIGTNIQRLKHKILEHNRDLGPRDPLAHIPVYDRREDGLESAGIQGIQQLNRRRHNKKDPLAHIPSQFPRTEVPGGEGKRMMNRMVEVNEKDPQSLGNNHPTVKPVALMRYLIKLVTPDGAHIIDPFAGSGSTGMAAKELARQFTGIDLDPNYCEIARRRIAATREDKSETLFE